MMPMHTIYLDEGPRGWSAGEYDVTRRDVGHVAPKRLLTIPGQKGEQSLFAGSASGRYSKEEWRRFVADIKKNGVRSPISILVLKSGMAVIQEGNHRIRAAIQAGRRTVPIEVSYYGNSQRHSLLRLTAARKRRR